MVTITRIETVIIDTMVNFLGIHFSHITHHDDGTCDVTFYLGKSWMLCCRDRNIEIADADNLKKRFTIGNEFFNEIYFS